MADAKDVRPYAKLGRRIAELREGAGYRQREFARLVPMSIGYLPKIETGRSHPEPETLRRIAAALDVSYDELAALAGWIDPPKGDVLIEVPSDNLPLRQRIANAPAEWLEAFEQFIARLHLKPPPDDEPSSSRDHSGHGIAGDHHADSDSVKR